MSRLLGPGCRKVPRCGKCTRPLGPDDEAHGKAYDGVALLHGNLGKHMRAGSTCSRLPSPHGFALLESILLSCAIFPVPHGRPLRFHGPHPILHVFLCFFGCGYDHAMSDFASACSLCLLYLRRGCSMPWSSSKSSERTPDEETAAETAENRRWGGLRRRRRRRHRGGSSRRRRQCRA